MNASTKKENAKRFEIPLVSEEWIKDCIAQGKQLPTKKYLASSESDDEEEEASKDASSDDEAPAKKPPAVVVSPSNFNHLIKNRNHSP